MNDEKKLELVCQMCQTVEAQDVVQMLKHEDEISDVISSIEDVDTKMRAIMEYRKLHENYTSKVFSEDFNVSTNERRFNLEDVLDRRIGQNITEIAKNIDDDSKKIKLMDIFLWQMTDEDRLSIIGTINSPTMKEKAKREFDVFTMSPEELANDEEARKASEEFDKEVRDDSLGKDENSLDDTENR